MWTHEQSSHIRSFFKLTLGKTGGVVIPALFTPFILTLVTIQYSYVRYFLPIVEVPSHEDKHWRPLLDGKYRNGTQPRGWIIYAAGDKKHVMRIWFTITVDHKCHFTFTNSWEGYVDTWTFCQEFSGNHTILMSLVSVAGTGASSAVVWNHIPQLSSLQLLQLSAVPRQTGSITEALWTPLPSTCVPGRSRPSILIWEI